MIKKSIFLFRSGILSRKDNTLLFETEADKKVIPVETVDDVHVFGDIDINKRVLEFLTAKKIPVHFYNYYGYYVGTYYPREYLNSGLMTMKQAEFYINKSERLYLAKSFVKGGVENIIKNLNYYNKKIALQELIKAIEELLKQIDSQQEIQSLMALEGNIRQLYYQSFNTILSQDGFEFMTREKRPPTNPINAMISFGNSILYTTILSNIYRTYLDPRIGYLHETNQRSFSLNLDIAEVFKPVLVDRVIFSLVNKKQITLKDFEESIEYTYLNENGRKKFISEFETKLSTTIKYKKLGNVSYNKLIKIECYKLYKHFLEEERYIPFMSSW